MESRLVGGAATDDHRDFELADKALQVEWLDRLGNVLGRHNRPLDDEEVQLCLEQRLGVPAGATILEPGCGTGGDAGGGGDRRRGAVRL